MTQDNAAISRRRFAGSVAGAVALSAASYGRVLGANDRVGVGFIGFGLIGKRHVLDFQAQPDVACVAISDAHRGRLDEGRALIGGNCRGASDFRRLLDDRDVQAVVVSTPDHWHALMTMLACAAGKDVYVEKPLTLFVREGRWMVEVARRHKSVVQVGTQQRSGRHYGRARQLIREGHIGRVHSVRMGAYRNIMPGFGTPADSNPPPELDWNMFLGPAPARAYNPNRGIYHFRWFWDYSGGQMTNLAHHALDIVHWTLGGELADVTSSGGRFALEDNGETPDTQDALFRFKSQGSGTAAESAAWTAAWSHREASAGPGNTSSIEFYGTKGMLSINRRGFKVLTDKRIRPANRVPQFAGAHPVGGPQRVATTGPDEFWTTPIEDSSGSEREQFSGHARNFLDCVKSRETPISDLESAHRVSTLCHLANLSLRVERRLQWDFSAENINGDREASAMLARPYRSPWDAELRALGVG
jgi:predicted dehydrogenase